MSIKKLIIAIIIIAVIFVFFIRYTFQSLQNVELTLDTFQIETSDSSFKKELEFLDRYRGYGFIDNFSLDNLQIVLINHFNEKAFLWNDLIDNGNKELIYKEIPDNIKYSNSFLVWLNKHKTLIINCDDLLGDTRERIIVDSYKYLQMSESKLNPKEISFFSGVNENVYERFLRNKMLESLLDTYINNKTLESFRFYYEKWQEEVGEICNLISEYDWYEGSKEYITVKVKQEIEEDFKIYDYIQNKRNKYGFFDKEDEYSIIGLIINLYAEKNDIILYDSSQYQNNIYKILLNNTPYISREFDSNSFEVFKAQYEEYKEDMINILETFNYDEQDIIMSYEDIISEIYHGTFKIDKNYYLYQNYKARLKDNSIVSKDYIFVRVSPYKIQYFSK